MEGNKIYEESGKELARIKKTLASDSTVINWNKLDERTKQDLNTAVTKVICERQREVEKITLGVQ